MGPDAWFALLVVASVLGMLIFTRVGADIVFMGGLTLLLVTGVLSPGDALAGFANPGMITVAALYVVVAGLQETGGVQWIGQRLLGRPKTLTGAQLRIMMPVAVLSAFLNNTPVVAMLIPAVSDWSKRYELAVSKLMIPLSYAAILGGTLTLIGTSTNLVVNGLLITATGLPTLHMFELAWVGLPTLLVGIGFIVLFSRRLLPDRQTATSLFSNPREYTLELLVADSSPLAGKTIEEAGLRHLPSAYLAEIERGGSVMPAVSPQERLRAGDRLVFVGVVESIVELQKIRGLLPATDQLFKLDAPRARRTLVEAVVSNSCPLVGKTIREGRFRSLYEAVVIAVARNGERIHKKIGDIVLQPGDTLLLEAQPNFAARQRNSSDFFLVSAVENSQPLRHDRALVAAAILSGLVLTVGLGVFSMLQASLFAAALTVATRCCTGAVARRSVDWSVLIVIAASLGLGRALEVTGAADAVAGGLVALAGSNPWIGLAVVYAITAVFTAVVTNNAAAVLMFPVALTLANALGVNFMPFVIAIMMGASASFATPIGYQTNLMVYGPGGYRFTDYLKIGLPLNLLTAAVAVLIIPFVWRF